METHHYKTSFIPPGLFPPAELGGWFAGSPEGAGLDTGGEPFGPGGPESISVLQHTKFFPTEHSKRGLEKAGKTLGSEIILTPSTPHAS